MPPLTRTAILRPRSAAGTSARSSGLTAPPPLGLQDALDLGDGPLGVVVHHHVVVAVGEGHLDPRQALPRPDLGLALHPALDAPAKQLLHRGRADEYVHRVRALPPH